jgi:thiamine-phosphate pyrophosphorylase
MANTHLLRGLYAITDPCAGSGEVLLSNVRLALDGGVRILQYRDKGSDHALRQQEASALLRLCREFDALFLVNDDVTLAAEVEADGVHLGRDDAALAEARRVLGEEAVIGISCYNRLALAEQAQAAGADYVAFGRFFPSRTKPDAVQAEPALLAEAKTRLSVPVVAIGGITPENGRSLIEHGADALAVIQGVFAQTDIRDAARRYASLFEKTK